MHNLFHLQYSDFDEEAEERGGGDREDGEEEIEDAAPMVLTAAASGTATYAAAYLSNSNNLGSSLQDNVASQLQNQIILIAPVSKWKNDGFNDIASVHINLPSGDHNKHQVKLTVTPDEQKSQAIMLWPELMSSVRKIKECLNLSSTEVHTNSDPKIQGYHDYYCEKRERDSDSITSFALIYLPFPVKKKLRNVKRCKDADGCHCIDVNLIAMSDNDYLDEDDDNVGFK